MTNIQPGWYKDPSGAPQNRWWDGARWTEHVSGALATEAPSPATVTTTTPFVWILAVLPIISIVTVLLLDPRQYFATSLRPDPAHPLAMMTPGYDASVLLGLVAYALFVVFAALDYRALAQRGLPRPFHWAWTFLSLWVYMIGRAVVVGRRTGVRDIAPLIVFIVVQVVASIVIFVVFIDAGLYAASLVTAP